jgi:hypothetical protein
MNKSVKKAIFTGSTALAILGAVFVPVSGADAATFYNGYNNPVSDMYKLDRDVYRGGNIYQLERDMSRIQRDENRLLRDEYRW